MKKGYRWYIELGYYGMYEPNETNFNTFEEALNDGIKHNYLPQQIGINYCSDDDGYIEIIKEIKKPFLIVWRED